MDSSPDHLRSFLLSTDIPCPSCEYNLRGLTGDTCPECSQRLVLRVGLAEPRQRAFIGAVIGFATGAGFSGFLFLFFLILGRGRGGDETMLLKVTGWSALIEGLALAILLLGRRRFQRSTGSWRAWIVAIAWLATFGAFAVFVAAVW